MNERYLNVVILPCGCTTVLDTLFWNHKTIEICEQHLEMQISISLAMMMLVSEEV